VHISNHHRRIKAVFLLFYAFFAISITRLLFIQFFRSDFLASIAKKQHNLYVELEPLRGTIYDANLRPLAVNISADSLYAVPVEIKDKEKVINALVPILDLDRGYLKDRLYRKKSFIWLARKISPEQKEAIKKLNIKGLDFMKESKRCYPNGYLASHVLGFAGLDNVGLEGLELYCDGDLKGKSGWALFLRDARQKKLNLAQNMVSPQNGFDVVLTIDEVIQYIAEKEIERAYTTFKAKGASIIVMDPHTGAILAMANRPTYDPNNFTRAAQDTRRNRAVCDLFEPGSVFKVITASAAIEEGKVAEEDKFFCENGSYKVASHTLHDHRPHGWLTFKEVIVLSSNIGTTKVAQILGNDALYRYVKLFGFGSKLGVDLPGEISGIARDTPFWSKLSIADN
jgi:cell division protein FtsI (penicillin-binding protein 3)